MISRIASLAPALLLLAGCAGPSRGAEPLLAGPAPAPERTLVWVGRAETERLESGTWRRVPAFDYDFVVEQRRYADHWESVKLMRRRDPAYDGSAGPRDQTLFFRVDFAPRPAGDLGVTVRSTLGDGTGQSDADHRATTLALRADVSRFAPFDTYRIAQTYGYEAGTLDETVSLDKGDQPWVRNKETARLYAPVGR